MHAECLHAGPAVAAHDRGGVEPGDAVDQVGAQQRGGELASAFDQQAGQAGTAPSACEPMHQVDPGGGTAVTRITGCAEVAEGFVAGRISAGRIRNQVGVSAAVAARREVNGVRRWLSATTRTTGVERKPGIRQVSSGLSARTVPTPTMTASCRPRRAWARRRAGAPVIHWLSPLTGGDAAVQRRGQFQRHHRAAPGDARG